MFIYFIFCKNVSGILFCFFFQAEDGIRDGRVTGVQTVLFRSLDPDTRARIKPPKNIMAAPPQTAIQRLQPAPFNSSKNNTPHRIPMRAFVFHRGKAMLRPRSRMAKMVRVLATDHRQPAMIAHMTRWGALRISDRIPDVPRAARG